MIIRKSQAEIEAMAAAGRIVADTLALLGESLAPGLTMLELDAIGDEYIHSQGGYPTSKGYKGFPAAICISPNSMIVHGIPGDYVAQEGDIVTFDVGVTLNGLIADSAATFACGEVSPEAQRLLDVCQLALDAGIEQATIGNSVSDISRAVQTAHRGGGLQRRTQPGRARGRTLVPRGPAGAEFRLEPPRVGAEGRDDDRDRADDHCRRP